MSRYLRDTTDSVAIINAHQIAYRFNIKRHISSLIAELSSVWCVQKFNEPLASSYFMFATAFDFANALPHRQGSTAAKREWTMPKGRCWSNVVTSSSLQAMQGHTRSLDFWSHLIVAANDCAQLRCWSPANAPMSLFFIAHDKISTPVSPTSIVTLAPSSATIISIVTPTDIFCLHASR